MATDSQATDRKAALLDRIAALDEALTRKAETSLHTFVQLMWSTVEPQRAFKDNWHIGAVCLPGSTKITTEHGSLDIGAIVATKWRGRVLSWNHHTEREEWRSVTAWMASPGRRLIRIEANDGRTITATDNHPIFVVGRGYVRADTVRIGDCLHVLSPVWRVNAALSSILRPGVFRGLSAATYTALRRLRQASRQAIAIASLSRVLRGDAEERREQSMSPLWSAGLSEQGGTSTGIASSPRHVLQLRMLRRVLSWSKQLAVCRRTVWRVVSDAIQDGQADSTHARRVPLSYLRVGGWNYWNETQAATARSAPYRLGQVALRGDQPRDFMQDVPRETRLESDPLSSRDRVGECVVVAIDDTLRIPATVYNIEVDGNHNYFADGVLVHNCEHLAAVRAGQIKVLVINQPPATTKSLTASVMFPAWCWATDAWMRFMCLSFDQSLSTRDNLRMRNVVESAEYLGRWDVRLSDDQNQKTRYNTTAGGWRIGTSMTGRIIGEHPHGKIVDDPHNPRKAVLTELELKQATDTWDYGLSTRGATLDAWTVLMMQRLHEGDLSGHVLASGDTRVVHLCLPMRYEPPALVDLGAGRSEVRPRMRSTPLGWQDPRTVEGDLLWPAEWPEQKVTQMVATQLGSWGEAGQFQQRPAPAGGLMFQRAWFSLIETLPADAVTWVRAWDVAGTEGGTGARTAGVKMGRTARGKFIIADIVKGRWGEADVEKQMLQAARLDGSDVMIREEEEPGSSGKAVVASRARAMAGYAYKGVRATGDKVTRARPLATQAEAGYVALLVTDEASARWAREFLDEITLFPAGQLKDQVDAAASALNALTLGDRGEMGLLFAGGATETDVNDLAGQVAALKAQLGVQ